MSERGHCHRRLEENTVTMTEEQRAARRRELIEEVLADYLDAVDPEAVDTQDLAECVSRALEREGL